ncbi:MAG: hypothetical protein CMH48_05785 [Muricauda sp.]|nr:DUF2064 domain-containing protein [Allomuricauda sp.]MAU25901.1 hypothetical protein [Allomuricauda sp.]MBC30337.1 hypothetical protein [Allomuricauda sp.]|tara:strand:- start:34870 stop:35568 length:699 start_codon:yes stop_codon:yes gene_type:complete
MKPQRHIKTASTAILVFALSAEEETKHKSIFDGGRLFEALTAHTLAEVKKTGLPHYLFTEKEQRGNSFGERFAHAIQSLFDLGHDKVITVGNDSPQLKARHLLAAKDCLDGGKNVLGPSNDGGFYLMGIQHCAFDSKTFSKLPWQTRNAYRETLFYFDRKGVDHVSLCALTDIDSLVDVTVLAYSIKSISRAMRHLLASFIQIENVFLYFLKKIIPIGTGVYHNKGSPLVGV